MKVVVRISSSIITSILISITIAWEDKITVIREIESVDYSSFIENLLILLIPLTLLLIGGIMGLAYYVVVRGMEYVVKRWARRRVKV